MSDFASNYIAENDDVNILKYLKNLNIFRKSVNCKHGCIKNNFSRRYMDASN